MSDGTTVEMPLRLACETATRSGRPVCLDASALVAYLANERHARHVAPLIVDSACPLVISAATLAELLVHEARKGRADAEGLAEQLLRLPGMSVAPVDNETAIESAIVRAELGLALPDALVVATARLRAAVAIVGNDRRWQRGRLGVPFICLDELE